MMCAAPSYDAKAIWGSIFKRKGGDGLYTRMFDRFDRHQQDMILATILLADDEVPILGSIRNSRTFLVLTNRRLVWAEKGEMTAVDTGQIYDVIADFPKLERTKRSKLEMDELVVETTTGKSYVVKVEPGPPLSGIWNVLKSIGHRNRKTGTALEIL